MPADFQLSPPIPNPTRGPTSLRLELPRTAAVSIKIYDVAGRMVRVLGGGIFSAGQHSVRWDGNDGDGNSLAAGLYFCRAISEGMVVRRGVVIVR
jgi:flagellar hook assembly protein FlgD